MLKKTLVFTATYNEFPNIKIFLNKINNLKERLDVLIIDGNREAELIYLGNKEAVTLSNSVSLIMDIGGGSNEFILANNTDMLWKQSFPVGAARMLEKFSPSDPITDKEIQEINNYMNTQLQPIFEAVIKFPPIELIGSSVGQNKII